MGILLSEGQLSNYKRAALVINAYPKATTLLADRDYDADWFRADMAQRCIARRIPSKKKRKKPIEQDKALYRPPHKIENMIEKLKTWRQIHTRYDQGANTFMSAIYSIRPVRAAVRSRPVRRPSYAAIASERGGQFHGRSSSSRVAG